MTTELTMLQSVVAYGIAVVLMLASIAGFLWWKISYSAAVKGVLVFGAVLVGSMLLSWGIIAFVLWMVPA